MRSMVEGALSLKTSRCFSDIRIINSIKVESVTLLDLWSRGACRWISLALSSSESQKAPSTMLRGKPLRMVPLPRVAALRRGG
jgi:hypothetical protein